MADSTFENMDRFGPEAFEKARKKRDELAKRRHRAARRRETYDKQGGRPRGSNLVAGPERHKILYRFCTGIELGMTIGQAAELANISMTSARRWITNGRKIRLEAQDLESKAAHEEGREEDVVVPDPSNVLHSSWVFVDQYEQARQAFRGKALGVIQDAAFRKGDWKAAKALLEADDNQTWGHKGSKADNGSTTVNLNLTPVYDVSNLSIEEKEKYLLGDGGSDLVSPPQVVDAEFAPADDDKVQ